jgi:hypothetical protein
MIVSLLAFISSAILLFLSSRALIARLMRLFFKLIRSQEGAVNLLFFLLLPGTLLHELSHLFSAELLQVPTGELSLKPSFEDSQLKLGSAQVGLTDPIRLTLIGTAPFVSGTVVLWLIFTVGFGLNLQQLSLDTFSQITTNFSYWYLLFGYLIFAIANTMFSSPSDLQAAALPVVLLLIFLGLFQLTNLNLPVSLIDLAANLFWLLTAVFSLVLVLNLLLLLPLRLLKR